VNNDFILMGILVIGIVIGVISAIIRAGNEQKRVDRARTAGETQCPICYGSGKRKCSHCKGVGKKNNEQCTYCSDGKVACRWCNEGKLT
jgi:hypothetical protein